MASAAADAAADSPPLPPRRPGPALARPELYAVKMLMFPCLAGVWVGAASAAAAAVAYAAFPDLPWMIFALALPTLGGITFAALLAYAVFLLLLIVALRDSDSILQACGPSLRSLLHDTTWLSCSEAIAFNALSIFGFFLAVELSVGSLVGRIGTLAIGMGAVIYAAISCIDILPSIALKLWRMKPGGAAAGGCVV